MNAHNTLAALLVAVSVVLSGCVPGSGVVGGPSMTRPTSVAAVVDSLPPRHKGIENWKKNSDLAQACVDRVALDPWKAGVSGVAGGARMAGMGAIGLASMFPVVGGLVGAGATTILPLVGAGLVPATTSALTGLNAQRDAAAELCSKKYLQ